MNGHCANCKEWAEVYHYRIAGLGLRYLDEKCIAWMQAVGMWITPVTDADPRRAVVGRRSVWPAAIRRTFIGRAIA